MAEARFSEDQFSCSVCLDLLKDPVTIPCGHSYCRACIADCWNQQNQSNVSCPQCRQTFSSRPTLAKNTILAALVEQLKKDDLKSDVQAGEGDVECDVCAGGKLKAVKACLVCLNSYCQTHLEQHESLFKGKRHNLIDATGRLQEMICHQHGKLLEIFCRTDQCCICMLCLVDEHKNHDTVSAEAGRTEKQKHFDEVQEKFREQIQVREKKLEELKDAVRTHGHSADTAVQDIQRISSEIVHAVEERCLEVTQMIREREKVATRQAGGILTQLDLETDSLRRKNASFPSLPVPPASLDVPNIAVSCYGDVAKSVSQLKQKVLDCSSKETDWISGQVLCMQIIPTPEYETREQFLQYFFKFTGDPNTVHPCLHLSRKNRCVTTGTGTQYPDHPDRFNESRQVLCRESVCGRSYWEVDWEGDDVCIAVSYKSISRKGLVAENNFGFNDQSWSLNCSLSSCSFWHNKEKTVLPVVPRKRVGVYVDHRAGILSFYSISDTMELIHRVHTTFSQPLHPGFNLKVRLFSLLRLALKQRTEPYVKLCDVY
ncbi:hypothetical protein DNTS_024564 [Danionella cerebrum]|uniref:RING-type domain-containing protein n=1 Tax=Danionella cerebrum TaxID=2873325 RepID=A0A553RA01_9TELE|nr:hypothetical protein DNTS_024564 [Danionella translucida]